MTDDQKIFVSGAIIMGLFAFILFLLLLWNQEALCEEAHNVYDCEWTANPYTPVEVNHD